MNITGSNVLKAMAICIIANSMLGWWHYGMTPLALKEMIEITAREYQAFLVLLFVWATDNYRVKLVAKSHTPPAEAPVQPSAGVGKP